MCGIVGYVGPREAQPVLLDGLRRLEYRGYDSAGVAVLGADGDLRLARSEGKLGNLAAKLSAAPLPGRIGLGHTRWATHGRPSEEGRRAGGAGRMPDDCANVPFGLCESGEMSECGRRTRE